MPAKIMPADVPPVSVESRAVYIAHYVWFKVRTFFERGMFVAFIGLAFFFGQEDDCLSRDFFMAGLIFAAMTALCMVVWCLELAAIMFETWVESCLGRRALLAVRTALLIFLLYSAPAIQLAGAQHLRLLLDALTVFYAGCRFPFSSLA